MFLQISLVLPGGFKVASLLDCVKEVVKNNMELRRDMPHLRVENKGHG